MVGVELWIYYGFGSTGLQSRAFLLPCTGAGIGGFAGRKDVVCESGRLHRAGKEQQQSLKPCSQSDVMIEAFTDPSSSHWSS